MSATVLLDSNIVIYAFNGRHVSLRTAINREETAIASVTMIEVLGFASLSAQDAKDIEDFFDLGTILHLNRSTIDTAIALRRRMRIELPDAIIAATALVHRLPLWTHNTRDFANIPGLAVVDPLP